MQRHNTFVATFYSFKGGVGRTSLLTNVGALLAQRYKVLLWDLDLEAPGMHHIPALKPKRLPQKATLEWLSDWQASSHATPTKTQLNALSKAVRMVPDMPGLSLLPAHGDNTAFANLYENVNWNALLVEQPERAVALFRRLLQHLAETGGYDFILLDARTGITDLGGLMAAVLPHATVLVSNYAAQNLAGALSIYRALQPAVEGKLPEREYPLQRLMALSPVPQDHQELLTARREYFANAFPLGQTETRIEIPFDSRLLFGEGLFALSEPESLLAERYQQVMQNLENLREDWLTTRLAAQRAEWRYAHAGDSSVLQQQFNTRVARLLRLLGYQVDAEQRLGDQPDDETVDLIAHKQGGLRPEYWLIECYDNREPVTEDAVQRILKALQGESAQANNASGMLIANRVTAVAQQHAKQHNIAVRSVESLEQRLFDFAPYLARLRRRFEESQLAQHYLPQQHENGSDLLQHALAWAHGNGPKLWLLSGEDGSGKSTFIKRLAYELAKQPEEKLAPIPLLIELKDFPILTTLEALFTEYLRREMDWHGNPEILIHLLAAGRIVILIDALDELEDDRAAQFRELVSPINLPTDAVNGNRLLITARRQVLDAVDISNLAAEFGAQRDELPLLDAEQIRQFIRQRVDDAAALLACIAQSPDLQRMAAYPILLDVITNLAPQLTKLDTAPSNAAELYQHYTQTWLTDHQVQQSIERLAAALWRAPQHRLHYRDIPVAIDSDLDAESLGKQWRSAHFLNRNQAGFYSFSHQSLREYFYAAHLKRMADASVWELARALRSKPLTPACVRFFGDLVAGFNKNQLAQLKKTLKSAATVEEARENALRLAQFPELVAQVRGAF